jgi:type IV pilus assembly protein PilA
MLHKLRQRAQDEKGFTLIELLVVILIIGILAAIALPAFLNQREKAQDSAAKSNARTVQTAEETYYTDNQAYSTDKAVLEGIEPAIKQFDAQLTLADNAGGYKIGVQSKANNGRTWNIERDGTGNVNRTCTAATNGSACPTAVGGNQW